MNMTDKKLAILDDFYPNLTTGFRIAEFNYYLERYSNSVAYVHRYDNHYPEFAATYPHLKDKVKSFYQFDGTGQSYALFYTVFLSNAAHFTWAYGLNGTPFVFELYPGGGFWLNDEAVDAKLKMVFSHPQFRKVIVTQKLTYDYIVGRDFVTPDKVAYIYGAVTHPDYFRPAVSKLYFGKEKNTFDICFVAHKYMPMGVDKGFPTFIETCKKLLKVSEDFRFHVVGNFEYNEADVKELGATIVFYGIKDKRFFPNFYSKMDVIVSPNLPFVLIPGKNFDGFPTGCCIDAALHNVAVFCTDMLHMNEHFKHEKDIFIIKPHADEIADNILEYYRNPDKLYRMSARGQAKFREVFDFNKQMEARTAVLEQFM
jgi:glycosyltransferase involved in cell wall biosynthesis